MSKLGLALVALVALVPEMAREARGRVGPAVAAASDVSEVIRTRRVEVVDDTGRALLILSTDNRTGTLSVLRDGESVAHLWGSPSGDAVLTLSSNSSSASTVLRAPRSGCGALLVFKHGDKSALGVFPPSILEPAAGDVRTPSRSP